MKAIDFEYDGIRLSDLGYMICTFDGSGEENYSIGSQLSFITTPVNNGRTNYMTGFSYDECITAEFQICKGRDTWCYDRENKYFTVEESRALARWLNRTTFRPLTIIDDGYENIYFEGSFNLSKIEINGQVVGFTLELTTNRPFGLHQPFVKIFTATKDQGVLVPDISDEIGDTYLDLEVTCKDGGNLTIKNDLNKFCTEIKNCTTNETITMTKDLVITSTNHANGLMNDFNFVFPRISNTFRERNNKFTFSLNCDVRLSYSPVCKVGI